MSRDRWEQMRNYAGDLVSAVKDARGEVAKKDAARKAEQDRPIPLEVKEKKEPTREKKDSDDKTIRGVIKGYNQRMKDTIDSI